MEKEHHHVGEQQRISDLRHLYRSITKMVRSDAVDTLLNHIVEDIIEATGLKRQNAGKSGFLWIQGDTRHPGTFRSGKWLAETCLCRSGTAECHQIKHPAS